MPKHRITITIAPDGKTTVGVNGVKGAGCKQLTAAFEQMLGKPGESKETSEFYEQPQVQTIDQSNG